MRNDASITKYIYDNGSQRKVDNIGPYLVPMPDVVVSKRSKPLSALTQMSYGSMSNDNGLFDVSRARYDELIKLNADNKRIIKTTFGGAEFIRGIVRRSIYIPSSSAASPEQLDQFAEVFDSVRKYRSESNRPATRKLSNTPMLFAERRHIEKRKIFVPQVMSERRHYITAGFLREDSLVIAPHMQIIEGEIFEFAILSSKLHHVWIATVCGRLKSDIRYSNLLGWNTFPIPVLTDQNRFDMSRCGQEILLVREAHSPATIAELYDPESMPENLRIAHEQNDEVLERAYIGRRFKNDTERLENLLELYTTQKSEQSEPLNGRQ